MTSFYTHVARLGGYILYRGYEDGEPVARKEAFEPVLFTAHPQGQYKALTGESLKRHDFPTMGAARDFVKEREGLSEAEVYGFTDYVGQFIQRRFPGTIAYDPDLVYSCPLDIEVHCEEGFPDPELASWPIDAITFQQRDGSYLCLTTLHAEPEAEELQDVAYRCLQFATEAAMLEHFVEIWSSDYPDSITGWNIRSFDVVYIVNRIAQVLGEYWANKLSPWRKLEQGGFTVKGQTRVTYEMLGIAQLDYMDLFKKFAYKYPEQESYKLDHIAHVVLGERKLSYEEYAGLHDLRERNPARYLAYNIRDAVLIRRMDDKLGLLDLVAQVAYKAGVNYIDTMGTTKVWDTLIYRRLDDQHVVVPPRRRHRSTTYEGAYVKEPMVGIHEHIVSFDLASLYPNTIVEYNMSPETFLGVVEPGLDVKTCLGDWRNETEHSIAANGVGFRKDFQGVLPKIIVELYGERKSVKAEMIRFKQEKEATPKEEVERCLYLEKMITRLGNAEQATKILLNSLYGAMGSAYFRYFELLMAEGITLSAQLAILTAERAVNQLMNRAAGTEGVDYVIAIDTDSLYVNMSAIVANCPTGMDPTDFLSKFSKEVVQPVIDRAYQDLHKKMGSMTPRMEMKREVIADSGFWTAKKRYVLNVLDSEEVRYAEPDLKIMGIEAIKSSTPAVVRDWMKEAFKMILRNDIPAFHAFVEAKRQEFRALEPEVIGRPCGVGEVRKYETRDGSIKKGTPQNSRASVVYNRAITTYGISDRYPRIDDADKIKYLHLKLPNPLQQPVVAFVDVLPREFGIIPFIDYETQFVKTFLAPIEGICEAINWTTAPTASLEAFFS